MMSEKTVSEKLEQVGQQMKGCGCALMLCGALLLAIAMAAGLLFS